MNALATRIQMRQLDEVAINKYRLDLLQMMEVAGFHLASYVQSEYGGKKLTVLVASGIGNNGGDGLVAARYLHNWGHRVNVYLTEEDRLKEVPVKQWQILQQMGVKRIDLTPTNLDVDVVIDALVGYGQRGELREPVAKAVDIINSLKLSSLTKLVMAFDNPSGLNVDSGKPTKHTVLADVTITLAAVKLGLVKPAAKKYTGKLFLADIGIPPAAYADVGIAYPFLGNSQLLTYP